MSIASDAAVDPSVLKGLADMIGPEALGAVIAVLLDSSPKVCAELSQAFDRGDAAAVRTAAHQLKGATSNLGASRLPDLCAAVEEQAQGGDMTGAARLVDAVRAEYRRVHEALATAGYP